MIEVEGEHTTAIVMGLSDDEFEDSAREQVTEIVNHEAFQKPIRVMPDVHVGAGAMVGFTMRLGAQIVPNVIGVDIGCGLIAARLSDFDEAVLSDDTDSGFDHDVIENRIRNRIPMGWGPDGLKAPERDYYHVEEELPWEQLNQQFDGFVEAMENAYEDSEPELVERLRAFRDAGGYDIEYYKELCDERAGTISEYFDQSIGINSVGTLGSGNHFIELAQSAETGEYWVVVHSGSRGVGENTAKYHQLEAIKTHDDRADRIRDAFSPLVEKHDDAYLEFDVDDVSDDDLLDWVQGGKGQDFINYDALKADFEDTDPERIEEIRNEFKDAVPDLDLPRIEESLDWLEGEAAANYLIDMTFCQMYARENRQAMVDAFAEELGATIVDDIHAVHNYIDFFDGVIRKGATRAYEGERAVIPFNMQDGTLIVRGKSNEEWNFSAPHGAGRTMSRTKAEDIVDEDAFETGMRDAGAYAGALPLAEAPTAYKNADLIQSAIEPTATVEDHLQVIHNFKADD